MCLFDTETLKYLRPEEHSYSNLYVQFNKLK